MYQKIFVIVALLFIVEMFIVEFSIYNSLPATVDNSYWLDDYYNGNVHKLLNHYENMAKVKDKAISLWILYFSMMTLIGCCFSLNENKSDIYIAPIILISIALFVVPFSLMQAYGEYYWLQVSLSCRFMGISSFVLPMWLSFLEMIFYGYVESEGRYYNEEKHWYSQRWDEESRKLILKSFKKTISVVAFGVSALAIIATLILSWN